MPSLRRGRGRKSDGLDLRQVELARGMVDIEADDFALGIEIDIEAFGDLARLGARRILSSM